KVYRIGQDARDGGEKVCQRDCTPILAARADRELRWIREILCDIERPGNDVGASVVRLTGSKKSVRGELQSAGNSSGASDLREHTRAHELHLQRSIAEADVERSEIPFQARNVIGGRGDNA